MSSRYANVIILAEDLRSANLLRRYVQRALEIRSNRQIRQIISPSARGDAKQWVLDRYADEVRMVRSGHCRRGLLVHMDADTDLVRDRVAELTATLTERRIEDRKDNDPICLVIPRRHTETWLCMLTDVSVTEVQDCKRDRVLADFDAAVTPAALRLFTLTRPNAQGSPLPSIAAAVSELRRLEL